MDQERFLDNLRPATQDDIREVSSGGGAIGAAIFTSSPGGIAPIVIFKMLHERFGKPNYWDDPPKILWSWALKCDSGVLTVYDWKGGWSIGYVQRGGPSPELLEDAKKLRDELVELGSRVRPHRKEAVGGVITNPYRIFADMAESLSEQVADLKGETESELEAYRQGRDTPRRAAWREREAQMVTGERTEFETDLTMLMSLQFHTEVRTRSFRIAAMLAHIVSLEGFLNVVYHLFMKPELADDQVRVRIEREPLDLKLRLVDTFCDSFDNPPIDRNSDLYKAFLHLVSLRTNFAHAKLTGAMHDAVVVEEGYPFLVSQDAPKKYGITSDPMALDLDMVEQAGRIIRSIVRQVIRSMKREVRLPFAIVHRYERIQYSRLPNGRVRIVLHPEEDYAPEDWIDEMLAGGGDEWQPNT